MKKLIGPSNFSCYRHDSYFRYLFVFVSTEKTIQGESEILEQTLNSRCC
jgi:hypothetical protein